MREIKFRAWHMEAKKMISWDLLQCLMGGRRVCIPSPITAFGGTGAPHSTIYEMHQPNFFKSPNITLMQWTGLKDRNGKDIYEGDVVGIPVFALRAVVEIDGGAFWPFASNLDCAPYPKPEECEIIGNIHESPELLQGASSRPEPASGEGPK